MYYFYVACSVSTHSIRTRYDTSDGGELCRNVVFTSCKDQLLVT